MSTNHDRARYAQATTTIWDGSYNTPFLEDQTPVMFEENVRFFCYTCDTQVGAYLTETYEPVCDRCFGQFIEVQENSDDSNNATTAPATATATSNTNTSSSVLSSTTTDTSSAAQNSNTTSNIYLTVPPHQDDRREREQHDQQRNSSDNDLQETQPGVYFRLYAPPATNSTITTSHALWHTTSTTTLPSTSSSPLPPRSPSAPSSRQHHLFSRQQQQSGRRSGGNSERKWWHRFSKRSAAAQPSSSTDTTTNGRSTNGRLGQFASLVRLMKSRNATSVTTLSSYHTANSEVLGQGGGNASSSSSAIETPRPSAWQDDEDEACAICSDELYSATMPAVKLDCQHIFHRACIAHWLERDTTCPYCRNLAYMSTAELVTRPRC